MMLYYTVFNSVLLENAYQKKKSRNNFLCKIARAIGLPSVVTVIMVAIIMMVNIYFQTLENFLCSFPHNLHLSCYYFYSRLRLLQQKLINMLHYKEVELCLSLESQFIMWLFCHGERTVSSPEG